jgi:hypothetical protein
MSLQRVHPGRELVLILVVLGTGCSGSVNHAPPGRDAAVLPDVQGGSGGSSSGGTGGTVVRLDAAPGTGGSSPTGGASGSPDAGRDSAADRPAVVVDGPALAKFSFFVTSLGAMQALSGSQDGFGGDLRFGEATGLAGADKICTRIAETSMPGAGAKGWRAFLSTVAGGENGGPVNAIDRVGKGPWYDRMGRLVAMTSDDLLQARPRGADPAIINDLPNETGVPNHQDGAPGCTGNACPDNHDTLTGTNAQGKLNSTATTSTCNDWTSKERTGRPWCGHCWPRQGSGVNWMSSLSEGGCAPGVNLKEMGGPNAPTVGAGGGYGGIYCFALLP